MDVTLSTQIKEQYFSHNQAQLTYVCLADGRLCDMTYAGIVQNHLPEQYHINETYLHHRILMQNEINQARGAKYYENDYGRYAIEAIGSTLMDLQEQDNTNTPYMSSSYKKPTLHGVRAGIEIT